MRTFHRLHLSSLLLRPGYPNPTGFAFPCCPLCYSLPCRNYAPPSKAHPITALRGFFHVRHVLLVEVGGFAPPSRTYFSLLHTAIQLFIISLFQKFCKLWWCPIVRLQHLTINTFDYFTCSFINFR